jgi:hypothetical protein
MTCRSTPADPALYAAAREDVKARVKRWPSAYASGLVVQQYKARGGTYTSSCAKKRAGLTKWFAEKWVNVCDPKLPPCGRATEGMTEAEYRRAYPKCRPLTKAKKMTARERKLACQRKRRRASKTSRVVWVT